MKVCLVTPAPPRSLKGNRVTAQRWADLLAELGHDVEVAEEYTGQPCEVLGALHALKSAPSVARFHEEHPDRPLLLALTGTDLYDAIHTHAEARRSLELATRLIALHPLASEGLPPHLRPRVRVILQSVPTPAFLAEEKGKADREHFDVCVTGHLRAVKDPFRTAEAVRLVPGTFRLRVLHLGGALSEDLAEEARRQEQTNPRYRWLGELPREEALRTLARCRLLSLTSVLEGGANVISEALAVDTPVVASHIPGSVGLLGADYPGYFPVGDTGALADLLRRAETDPDFYDDLRGRCRAVRPQFEPARERETWAELLCEVEPEA
jgi:putative glycosyltransferase (TIGR04348 family)